MRVSSRLLIVSTVMLLHGTHMAPHQAPYERACTAAPTQSAAVARTILQRKSAFTRMCRRLLEAGRLTCESEFTTLLIVSTRSCWCVGLAWHRSKHHVSAPVQQHPPSQQRWRAPRARSLA